MIYKGEIWLKRKSKPTFLDKLFGDKEKIIVHRFSSVIIQANNIFEAREKMKIYTEESIREAKELPDSEFMKKLEHDFTVIPMI